MIQDIKIVDAQGKEVVESQTDINATPDDMDFAEGEISRVAVAQVFNMKSDEIGENKQKMDTLIKWAKEQTEDHSMQNLKWVIKNLEMRLGSPAFGENRITKVARYAALDLEGKRIEREKEQLYG